VDGHTGAQRAIARRRFLIACAGQDFSP